MKKSENYDKLFQGVSVSDIASMEEWNGGGQRLEAGDDREKEFYLSSYMFGKKEK